MKISATAALAVIASINAELAMARCYKWGWGTPTEAKGWVDFACKGNGGMFTGNFNPGQTKSMCPKSGSLGTLFEVQNQNPNQGFDLGDDDCVKRLYSEIDSCHWGGESSYSGWRFRWVIFRPSPYYQYNAMFTYTLTGSSHTAVKRCTASRTVAMIS
jgi:hypothetical protein